jgi:hypothetical protein
MKPLFLYRYFFSSKIRVYPRKSAAKNPRRGPLGMRWKNIGVVLNRKEREEIRFSQSKREKEVLG